MLYADLSALLHNSNSRKMSVFRVNRFLDGEGRSSMKENYFICSLPQGYYMHGFHMLTLHIVEITVGIVVVF